MLSCRARAIKFWPYATLITWGTGSVCIRIPNCDKQDWDTEHLRPKSIQSQPFGWDFYPGKFPDLLKATYRAIHSDCGLGHTMPNLTSSLLLLDRWSRRGCRTCHKQARLQGHLGSQHLAQNPWQNLTEAAKASTHSTPSTHSTATAVALLGIIVCATVALLALVRGMPLHADEALLTPPPQRWPFGMYGIYKII